MAMVNSRLPGEVLSGISARFKEEFDSQKSILSFEEYLELLFRTPRKLTRNAAEYMKDMIDYFGVIETTFGHGEKKRHFKVFDRPVLRTKSAIVGQDDAHDAIYSVLEQFVRQGRVDKLIFLHGPNGSSKSSTAESLAQALEDYSKTDDGAVYRFNWIFPNDKIGFEGLGDARDVKRIGFGEEEGKGHYASFAHLQDEEVSCKIISELKESPLFILPLEERMAIYKSAIRAAEGRDVSDEEIPPCLREGALGAKSKRIFDSLLTAYQGDLSQVLKHVQVERFFFSGRYRTGIATIEPQMHVDAQDRQLTQDRNLANLPPALQNIRIYEPSGELIDANRGLIEFADLLKRPLEAFKYLLTTIESMTLSLASGDAVLDLVMMASSNEKHLDAFKASPDWASFKGRFELVRVPYLLSSKMEQRIYANDVRIIERSKSMGPHALELLAKWAVLTRLKQPDTLGYDPNVRGLIERLSPFDKLALYDGEDPGDNFNQMEKHELKKLVGYIRKEGQTSAAYEGRFGASPREIKTILYFSSQNNSDSVSALSVFDEIEGLMSDRTVYDYLQFEPREGYHDLSAFLKFIQEEYAKQFSAEFLAALNLFDEKQYAKALERYLQHVVAYIKGETVYSDVTHKSEQPDETMMNEIEDYMRLSGEKREVREGIVAKIASWRVDNPGVELDISKVFSYELKTISSSIYESRREYIERVRDGMVMWGSEDYERAPTPIFEACERTFENLRERFGYTRKNAWQTLVFVRQRER